MFSSANIDSYSTEHIQGHSQVTIALHPAFSPHHTNFIVLRKSINLSRFAELEGARISVTMSTYTSCSARHDGASSIVLSSSTPSTEHAISIKSSSFTSFSVSGHALLAITTEQLISFVSVMFEDITQRIAQRSAALGENDSVEQVDSEGSEDETNELNWEETTSTSSPSQPQPADAEKHHHDRDENNDWRVDRNITPDPWSQKLPNWRDDLAQQQRDATRELEAAEEEDDEE
ncbi:hypothetical protein BLNAU_4142 [Blattamonas nauphoetae]|uniref:Uncharacterized protein n=1 Tax=Blattamonas nauphoetae TaxID=2049346 RepID=A0ABQ9WVW5_9EUKA|nr:hypothetical protein BLNAU_24469 [Blattamonas nauphoetae]KAK2942852.1 hypothetical protein BLNAU_22236 [Blattamonas nauphoetae]KAK2960746.1 hypothetical protein BLNAU_4142 [Blattamonas nauphoetae]